VYVLIFTILQLLVEDCYIDTLILYCVCHHMCTGTGVLVILILQHSGVSGDVLDGSK